MSEMILPGTYIDVLAEGLIAPGQVTVGNLGVLGTAAKGPVGVPTLLSSYNDAIAIFGSYDSFLDPEDPTKRRQDSLTLVRALEIAFQQNASIVWAVRVGNSDLAKPHHLAFATAQLNSASGPCVTLQGNSQGTWANDITVTVTAPGSGDVLTVEETSVLTQPEATAKQITLKHNATQSPRNRVLITMLDGSVETPAIVGTAPAPHQVQITGNQLMLGDDLTPGCIVTVGYAVDPATFVNVTVTLGTTKEQYLVADGDALITAVNVTGPSALVTATADAHSGEHPTAGENVRFAGGWNGESEASYSGAAGLDTLLDVDAHIIVAAGQANTTAGAALDAHCQQASTDVYKRDRIAIVGSEFAKQSIAPLQPQDIITYVDNLLGNTLSSDRVVFVAPGFLATSSAPGEAGQTVLLPGAYTAAAIAGMLAALPPHISLTNKPVAVQDVEVAFNNAQLTELVQNRVTAIEKSNDIHVLRGQTTQQGPFREITTRRIVDFAKYGVRSAAAPYIGLLNNDRVRAALRATINSFLKQMLDGEMLVSYTLDVTATRDQQIAGIAQVTITLQPVFSINFIHVTMILS
jgi:hypothetical protein